MSSSEDNINEEDNTDESSYYDSSDEESFDESKVGIALELPKRQNRGKKYTQLVGEELEKDQQFWGHSTWQEDEVDDDYNCSEGEEQYAYSTDSDFDDPEEEENEEVDESQFKEPKKKKFGAYVDPMLLASKRTIQALTRRKAPDSSPSKKQTTPQYKPTLSPEDFKRERRETTKQKTEAIRELEEYRKIKKRRGSNRGRPKTRTRLPKVYTQEELIEEAKRTEEANRKSLKSLQAWEDERKKYTETKRSTYKGHYDIWISWNSLLSVVNPYKLDEEGNPMETISPQVEEKPLELYMFTTGKLPEYYEKARMDKIALESSEKPKCAITGQEAKYLDPVTRKYYSTVEAFKMLRVQYNDEKSDITEPKIYNLNDETPNYVKCED
ncbi:YL1 nuclear family protein [Theileria parva strain Muguga]|uniref:Vps72/YL1 C-terminal domain-containing protein n=1 Tax=Theileria parva TaxID=5875 RepID=Q4N2B7_THEPA|nr:YL1 nuclear family protein [Theileria parva strain Muguga]EAN31786.1 YL1 nuclear family protein [Theileria parva strain Muguga]|eukprot:XP_764069.1 hypothetical protein [Theileria parva strain Muguga]